MDPTFHMMVWMERPCYDSFTKTQIDFFCLLSKQYLTVSCILAFTLLFPVSAGVVPALCPRFVASLLPGPVPECQPHWTGKHRVGWSRLGSVLSLFITSVGKLWGRTVENKSVQKGGNGAFGWWEKAGFSILTCLYVCAYSHVCSCWCLFIAVCFRAVLTCWDLKWRHSVN